MKDHHDSIIDTIEVLGVGGTGFALVMTDIELILKVLIGVSTLGFIWHKWWKETKK